MTLNEKIEFVDALYLLQHTLYDEAEENDTEVDETLDEAIRTLLCYLD